MITDVVTVQSSRVKTQIIKLKVQCSKDKRIRVIREIRSSYHKVQTSMLKVQR